MSELYLSNGTQKCCANCQYWTGARKVDAGRFGIYVEQLSSAECTNRHSFNRMDMNALAQCNEFEVWSVLD